MRASKAFCTVDGESLTGRDRRVLGSPADVIAADAKVRILRVQVIRVTNRAVLEHRNGYAT